MVRLGRKDVITGGFTSGVLFLEKGLGASLGRGSERVGLRRVFFSFRSSVEGVFGAFSVW